MKTIAQILKSSKDGDIITDGKRYWLMNKGLDRDSVAIPIKGKINKSHNPDSFELWPDCKLEKAVVLPGLKILK